MGSPKLIQSRTYPSVPKSRAGLRLAAVQTRAREINSYNGYHGRSPYGSTWFCTTYRSGAVQCSTTSHKGGIFLDPFCLPTLPLLRLPLFFISLIHPGPCAGLSPITSMDLAQGWHTCNTFGLTQATFALGMVLSNI